MPGLSQLPARAAAWVRGHPAPAAAGAGVLGVGGYAIYKKRQASAAADAGGAAAAADPNAGMPIAGLSGSPAGSDAGSAFQDQLNALADLIDQKLSDPKAPAPKPPPPVAKPGQVNYTVQHGDTLAKIAQKVYGSTSSWAIVKLKVGNPIWATFGPNDSLSHWAGRAITVPAANSGDKWKDPKNPNNTYHPPKKPPKKKSKK